MKKFLKNKFLYVVAGLLFLSPFATVPMCISVLAGAKAVTACAGLILGSLILSASVATVQYSINCAEKMKKDPNFGDIRFLSGEPVGYDDDQQVEFVQKLAAKRNRKTKVVDNNVQADNTNDLSL